ncbi:MAG: hypothetical protein Q9207_001369 [Kuettlingeria erythrocarpa]
MMVTSYLRFALLLAFLYLLSIHLASSHALPATRQNPESNPALQVQNAQAIERNIRRLMLDLTLNPDVRYSEAKLVHASFAVDHVDDEAYPFVDNTRSSNIADFRDIVCIFQYGGPAPLDPMHHEHFRMKNRWPFRWEQWLRTRDDAPPGLGSPIDWDMVMAQMPIGRADALLKASGQRGPYARVSLLNLGMLWEPLVWCFYGVQVSPGVFTDFRIEVETDQVRQYDYCLSP